MRAQAGPRVAPDRDTYEVGQRILVDVAAPAQASLVLKPRDDPKTALRTLEATGSPLVFGSPLTLAPGPYEVRLEQGAKALARAPIDVVNPAAAPPPPRVGNFTAMTLNAWGSGQSMPQGPEKIAEAIAKVDADVVGLPECNSACADAIIQALRARPGYANATRATLHSGMAIASISVVSRWPIERTYRSWKIWDRRGVGIKVDVDGRKVRFLVVHLWPLSYTPYAARAAPNAPSLPDLEGKRAHQMRNILKDLVDGAPKEDRDLPIVVCGDFNSPSHLDWTDANRAQNFGHAVEFAASKLLEDAGFIDAFRAKHPDPIEVPGFTWAASAPRGSITADDVHDRIDRIDVRGSCEVHQAFTYETPEWPSDHAAVVARLTFE